jgi:putative MATE family efflux protein
MAQAARRPGVNVFDESKPMWQLLGVFLLPLVASNILQTASQTMSAIWIGRLLGVQALGAVSAVFPIVFLLVSFLIGIGSGSTVLIGQAYGARDEHRVKRVAGTALGVALYLGIAVAVFGYFVSPQLLRVLGTPPDIIAMADTYAKSIFLTFPVVFPYIVFTFFLRGTGDSTTPFQALIVSSLLVIAITPLFIVGAFGLPKLGVVSAAVASAIASAIALAWLMWHLNRIGHVLKFDREMLADMIVDWKLLGAIVRIGIPTGVQIIMISLAEIAVLSFVNRFGSHATAAYGAVNQVVSYVQFPAISISIAASIFCAQCIGAKRPDKLGSVIRSAVGLNYAIELCLILVCYVFSWYILGWFITAPNTLAVAHALLAITLWSYALYGNWAVLSGIMRGSGDVIWPTAIGIFAIWGFEVPSAYFLMHRFGLDGVWMGYPIAFSAGLVMQFCYYNFVWKRKTHERLV